MKIATLLGVSSMDEDLLVLARQRWESWVAISEGALDGTPDLPGLADWLWDASPDDADRVLVHLAFLAAHDGADDVAAAAVLSWVLLPGAQAIVRALSRTKCVIDEVVAAQLWVQVRTFAWRTGHRVASNILWSTRNEVLADIGLRTPGDLVWRNVVLIDPTTLSWQSLAVERAPAQRPPDGELLRLLNRACREKVITTVDRDLLIDLAKAAARLGCSRNRSAAGMLGNTACEDVAHAMGLLAPFGSASGPPDP